MCSIWIMRHAVHAPTKRCTMHALSVQLDTPLAPAQVIVRKNLWVNVYLSDSTYCFAFKLCSRVYMSDAGAEVCVFLLNF